METTVCLLCKKKCSEDAFILNWGLCNNCFEKQYNEYMEMERDGMVSEEIKNLELNQVVDYQLYARGTAVYPNQMELGGLLYVVLGLVGEAGEVAEKVKKLLRDHNGELTPEYRELLLKEVGDVCWYIANVCSELDYSMADLLRDNLLKLYDRKERDVLKGNGDTR